MKREWFCLAALLALNLCLLRDIRFAALFTVLMLIYSMLYRHNSERKARQKYSDILLIFLIFLALWSFLTGYVTLKNPGLYPAPTVILNLLVADFPRFLLNFAVSMQIFLIGLSLAMLVGLTTGILIGLHERLRNAFSPYIKIIGSISPIAYVPYIIGIMPTFRSASAFVVFFGTVWPVIKWTIYGVISLDRNIYTGAKLLNVRRSSFLTGILLPGILPSVLEGATQAISLGFSVLVAAEMIGARNGLGFYIKYYADFLNYPKVLAGIIYLGISICLVTWLLDKLKSRLLKWQK